MPSPSSPRFPYPTLFRSTIEHLTRDYVEGPEGSKRAHFEEWSRLVNKRTDPALRSEERVSRNAEPELSTLSLPDALPIYDRAPDPGLRGGARGIQARAFRGMEPPGRQAHRPRAQIGRAGQQECRARALHAFPTRRSSDLRSSP